MQLNNLEVIVFQLDDFGKFDHLGEINEYTSLSWPDKYNGFTTFELYAPVTVENQQLIQKGNILWCRGDNAAIIEIIHSETNSKGQKTYLVKGRTLEMYLTTRIVWGTYSATNKYTSTIMYDLVNQNCVSPALSSRKIPFLECAEDEFLGKQVSYQKTGGEVHEALLGLAADSDLGFNILFRPLEKKLIFKVLQGVDRSVVPTSEEDPMPVVLSTDLEDILSSSYYTNNQDVKNVAYVNGEGEGADRKRVISGESDSSGFGRRELYVDAKDLRSEVFDEDGTSHTISEAEYSGMLDNRGNEKLAECDSTETFDVQVRVTGGQYVYGVDYNKGDKVIAQDLELGVQVVGRITEACENYGSKQELILTFGYAYPTLIRKIKQQLS